MTPEQRALMPDHEPANTEILRTAISNVDALLLQLRAGRTLQCLAAYPKDHAEHCRVVTVVQKWEREHGPLPESAERVLGV